MSKVQDRLYELSPAFLQNIGVSLYGLKLYRREYGRKFREALEQFEKQAWWSREELAAYQDERLRQLIHHCYHNVPYYRQTMDERKLGVADIATTADLPKLPVLTRQDVRDNLHKLIATNIKPSRIHHGHTSGTTGSPLHLAWDDQICLMKTVVDWRQKRWAGISPGDRMAFFLGRAVVPLDRKRPPFWRHNWVLNHLFCSSWHMSPENLEAYLAKLQAFQPRAVEGYPSTIFILASFLLSTGRTLPMTAVFTSSEPLMPRQREAIERAFECRVFDFYGMSERVIFATECPTHQGKHLNTDFGITEIVGKDGEPVPAGQLGRVVATGLHNMAMPLVRYQSSDVTGLSPDPCPCGRGFPLMTGVATKDEDILTTVDGRYVSSSILNALTHHLTGIAESQIVQEDRAHVTMKIVKGPTYDEKDTPELQHGLERALGSGMIVVVEFVDAIPRTAAGKFRWVISKVPLEF